MNDQLIADAHFEAVWGAYESFLAGRGILDRRLRQLAIIGQCTAMGEEEEAEEEMNQALNAGVATPKEILEVILQARVYVGKPKAKRTLRRFFRLCEAKGIQRGDFVADVGPDGWMRDRDLDDERQHWLISTTDFPQRDEFIEKYGWEGMSIGMMMQPANFPSVISKSDELDERFAKAWIDVVHAGMYARPILSQADRTLIMIADTIGAKEMRQATYHMTNAMKLGIHAAQILEICFLSTIYAGMPSLYSAFVLKELCDQQGISLR